MLRDFCSKLAPPGAYSTGVGNYHYNEGPSLAESRARLIGLNVIQKLDVFEIATLAIRRVRWLRADILRGSVQLNNVAPNLQAGINNTALALTRNRINVDLAVMRGLTRPGGPLEDIVDFVSDLVEDMTLTRSLAVGFFFGC